MEIGSFGNGGIKKHGTTWSYEKGCRCEECKSSESARNKELRKKRTPEKREEDLKSLAMLREKDPEKNGGKLYAKRRHLKHKYGMTLEQYEDLMKTHNHRCDTCGSREKLCVDHNHSTGKVRGVLCGHCNKALGLLRERVDIMYALIDYTVADTLVEFP